jgi:hypothetical protein
MPRQYPPLFRHEMIDRMLGGETVLALVGETGVPEQTLHWWKHQALIDAGLVDGVDSSEQVELRAAMGTRPAFLDTRGRRFHPAATMSFLSSRSKRVGLTIPRLWCRR